MMSATCVNDVFSFFISDITYQNIFAKYISNKDLRDEFKQFIYLILLEQSEKTVNAWNAGFFRFYFSRIISNNIKSNDSPWHCKYRKQRFENIDDQIDLQQKEDDITFDNIYNNIDEIISLNIKDKPKMIMHFNLFKMYYIEDKTFEQISKKTKIPYSSIRNYIEKARFIIQKELAIKYYQ